MWFSLSSWRECLGSEAMYTFQQSSLWGDFWNLRYYQATIQSGFKVKCLRGAFSHIFSLATLASFPPWFDPPDSEVKWRCQKMDRNGWKRWTAEPSKKKRRLNGPEEVRGIVGVETTDDCVLFGQGNEGLHLTANCALVFFLGVHCKWLSEWQWNDESIWCRG